MSEINSVIKESGDSFEISQNKDGKETISNLGPQTNAQPVIHQNTFQMTSSSQVSYRPPSRPNSPPPHNFWSRRTEARNPNQPAAHAYGPNGGQPNVNQDIRYAPPNEGNPESNMRATYIGDGRNQNPVHRPAQRPQGPAQHPQGPAQYPQGPAQYSQGPAQRPQGPAQRPQGPAQRPQGLAQRPQGPAQCPQGLAQRPQGPAQYPQGPAQRPQIPAQRPQIPAQRMPVNPIWNRPKPGEMNRMQANLTSGDLRPTSASLTIQGSGSLQTMPIKPTNPKGPSGEQITSQQQQLPNMAPQPLTNIGMAKQATHQNVNRQTLAPAPAPIVEPTGVDISNELTDEILQRDKVQCENIKVLADDIKKSFNIERSDSNLPMKRRPDFGQVGRKFPVRANHFPLSLPSGNIYHYDVDISLIRKEAPSEAGLFDKKKMRPLGLMTNRRVIEKMRLTDPIFKDSYPAYDGNKNLFTKQPLAVGEGYTLTVHLEEEGRKKDDLEKMSQFKVCLKPVAKRDVRGTTCAINLDTLHHVLTGTVSQASAESVMAIETILRHCPSLCLVPVARSLYIRPDNPHEISGGLNLWFGYHQGVQIGQKYILLNVDQATTAFYPTIPLLDYVFKILSTEKRDVRKELFLRDNDIYKLTRELKNLKIFVRHLKFEKKFNIFGVSKFGANDLKFTSGDKESNVAEYFSLKYDVQLKYPRYPCVNVGNSNRPVYQPFEMCFIKDNQPYRRKLSENQTSDMIKYTAIKPKQRFDKIQANLEKMSFTCDPVCKEFGIKICKKPIEFLARQIAAPTLVYQKNANVKPRDGVWDLRNAAFYEGKEINRWVILNFAFTRFCGPKELNNFAYKFAESAQTLGMKVADPLEVYADGKRERPEVVMKKFKAKYENLDLMVVVMTPETNYAAVKHTGDTVLGIPTQCVKDSNVVKKCNGQFLCNFLQKINAKLGGINTSLSTLDKPEIFKKPIIIIGADVNHPAPGDSVKPSIAAVVGSLDSHPSRYVVAARVQAKQNMALGRVEIITDLKDMIKEILKAFYNHNRGVKPEKIIVFRDGVGDGQFEEVRNTEIKMIQDACRELGNDYFPPLTFLIIQKRHHTRFMPARPGDGVGKSQNIPPGTTIDTDVLQSNAFDFYQCSHFGIQGTSRPTKYSVLYDDNNFGSDEIQKLTYFLCHTYARCTRSISVPSPVMYAHLAAFRAKDHLSCCVSDLDCAYDSASQNSGDSGRFNVEISQEFKNAIKIPPPFKKSMYYV